MKTPDLIAGKYEVLETIGRGGMGTVYKARQRSLDRIVAIKMLSEELASDTEFRARFQQEATIIAKLNHPNIVDVHDIEPHDHTFCIIMEYVEGETLQAKIDRDVILPEREAVMLASQVARALGYAHAQGIVHRDIKPDNILVTADWTAKVMDFGIARFMESKLKTQTGISMGTPKFMSPEQVTGKNVDGQTDLYSLGICLYCCLVGKPPFDGENAISIATRHLYEQPAPPSQFNTAISAAVEKVILKALEKNKSVRYATGQEMADALEDALGVHMPIRIAEHGEVASGATQKLSMPVYGVSGTEVYVSEETPRTPTGIYRLRKSLVEKIKPLTDYAIPAAAHLEDFPKPAAARPPSETQIRMALAPVKKWWPAAAALLALIMGILLYLGMKGSANTTAQPPPAIDSKANAQERISALEVSRKLAGEGKIVEAYGKLAAVYSANRNDAEVERAMDELAVALPSTETAALADRRDKQGNRFANEQLYPLAKAYIQSAKTLYAGLGKSSYPSGERWLPNIDRRLQQHRPDPTIAAAHVATAKSLQQTSPGFSADVEKEFARAISADPANLANWSLLVSYYMQHGKKDDARVLLQHMMEQVAPGDERGRLAKTLQELG